MYLASFDVGIKNMAYCVFDCSGETPIVVDWNVVNLIKSETPIQKLCHCNKKAKYEIQDKYFCGIHAKSSGFMMPIKECSQNSIKKLKKQELVNLAKQYFIYVENENRDAIQTRLLDFFASKMLTPIKVEKKKADEVDLITIGRNLKREFDAIDSFKTLDLVIIENQISPIATRMKTIQGMLAQYFIMRNDDEFKIQCLSSSNKLKGFEKMNDSKGESEYVQHKKDAIYYCSEYLKQDAYCDWIHVLSNPKKDDLADCFLQGMWYIQTKFKSS
jgi:hypothetical protein